jgi:putative membrane protein
MSQSNSINRALGIAALAMMFGAGSVYAQSSQSAQQSPSIRSSSGMPSDSSTSSSGSSTSGAHASASSVSHADKSMMDDLAKANLSEIETAKLVLGKTQNDQVKQFAQKMIDDHTNAQQELEQLAQQKNVKLPTEPDLKHKAEMKMLSAMEGEKLDKAYMSRGGLSDHKKAHELLAKIESKAKDADLKSLAGKLMPVIDQHLAMARDVSKAESSGNTSGASMGAAGTSGTSSTSSSGSSGSGSKNSTGGTGVSGTSGSSNSTAPGK